MTTCVSALQHVTNLSDVKWTISNHNNVTVPGKLPSQAHLDLLAAGVIGEPIHGFNEYDQYWVERSNWTWTSEPIAGL